MGAPPSSVATTSPPEKPKPAPFGSEDEIIEDEDTETQASEATADDEDQFFEDTEGDTTEY